MSRFFVSVGIGFFLSLTAFSQTKTSTCERTQFDRAIYPHLLKTEPRLKEHLLLIRDGSKQSGAEMALTNCQVRYPVDNEGKVIDGQWQVIMDHVWETRSSEGKTRRHQAGIRIVFDEETRGKQNPVTCDIEKYYHYNVRGVSYCWGPDGCTAMGIPFPADRSVIGRARWRWPVAKTSTTNTNAGWTPITCPSPSYVPSPIVPSTIYYSVR